jgi:hypothetical protein
VKRYWTFHDRKIVSQGGVEEMGIEFKVDGGLHKPKKVGNGITPHHLVCGSHVCKRPSSEMLRLKQFTREEVSVIHKSAQLRVVVP